MAGSPTKRTFVADDGVELAWHELGEGRPVVLLHGLFSNAATNWLKFGHAATIAATGFRVIMPDLRAHGDSASPRDPAFYPPDILADDGLALIAHLGLIDYDLGGYSLGARTCVRMVVRGAQPRRLIIAGMGLDGMIDTGARGDHFKHILNGLGTHPRGSPEWMAEAFLKTTGGDPEALLPLIESFVDTSRAQLRAISMPTLVLAGEDDQDNGSAAALAAAIPGATFQSVPGNHMRAVTKADLGEAMAAFLAD
ncbi:MAG: alpha/beta fold hydrolase [Sphingomonas sp.]